MRNLSRQKFSEEQIAGFSLIELMVTLSIAAVLAMLVAPSIRDFIVRGKLTNSGNELTAGILRARNEAINRNSCVTLCMSETSGAASPTCTTKGVDWQVGWIAFVNSGCNASANKPLALDDLIVARESIGTDILIQVQKSPPVRKIMFSPRGAPGLSGAAEFDVIYRTVNNPLTNTYGFNICLDVLGRSRTIPTYKNCAGY